jgi:hypothetical protein
MQVLNVKMLSGANLMVDRVKNKLLLFRLLDCTDHVRIKASTFQTERQVVRFHRPAEQQTTSEHSYSETNHKVEHSISQGKQRAL